MNMVKAFAAASCLVLLATHGAGAESTVTVVRDFQVGMPVAALPQHGYAEFRCVAGGAALDGWTEYAKCPVDGVGRHEVAFRYDDNGEHETKIAGQPVLLSLAFSGDGTVQAIRIQTDPSARLFLRKRGYIFGEQVMARFGEYGWACKDSEPSGGEEPVGGVFVRQHCEKTVDGRQMTIDRELFRAKDKPVTAFTSATTFTVSMVQPGQG